MTGPTPVCQVCRHLDDNPFGMTCAAFPDGIPDPILKAQDDHTTVGTYAQVGQFTFQPVPGGESFAADIQAEIQSRKG